MARLQTATAAEDTQQDTRQDVEEKLADLLPFILSSQHLKRQRFYIIGTAYGYSRDVLSMVAGISVGFPFATLLASHPKNFQEALSGLDGQPYVLAIILIVVSSLLKVYIIRESVEKRVRLVQECEKKLESKYIDIVQALQQKNPVKKLAAIFKEVTEVVRHHQDAGSYTFRYGPAPGTGDEGRVLAKKLCDERESKRV